MPRRARFALGGALGGVVLLVLTWWATFHVGLVERADQSVYATFSQISHRPRVSGAARFVADLCNPSPYVFLAAVPLLVALIRRRGWLTLAIAAILLGANVTTHLLKPLLAHPRAASLFGGVAPVAAPSWPSGHATAAMTLTLSLLLAAPARWRPYVAAVGAAFTVAVCYSFLTLGWHYPSDVFGGFLVAGSWALLAVAAMYTLGGRPAARSAEGGGPLSLRAALAPPALALLGAVALVGVVALARPVQVVDYVHLHHAFVVVAGSIAVLALALVTGLMLTLRR